MYSQEIRIADLLLENKNLKAQIKGFKTGEKYVRMQKEHQKELAAKDREIKKLKAELAAAHAETVDVRKKWMQANEDLLAEKEAAVAAALREAALAKEGKFEAERQHDEAKDMLGEKRKELYDAQGRLEEEQEKNRGLTAQINRDYTNSGKSSSLSPNHKKIQNSREKSSRKPGGQPGHPGHGRARLTPTRTCVLPTPEEFLDKGKYHPTGSMAKRQLVKIYVVLDVTEYEAEEFTCIHTGKKVHAGFPPNVTDDVTYDGTVKAIAYLLNNGKNVSIAGTRDFLKEISGGELNLSTGMICNLSREFSRKTKKERGRIFRQLLASPVLNADFTFGRVDGSTRAVIITTADGLVLYQAREKKGHEGVKGSPVELYGNTLVSDHESTFHKYGSKHQECLVHVERYLRSSIENEPDRKWNAKMLDWVKEAIHYRNGLVREGAAPDEDKVTAFEKKYEEILKGGMEEYEDIPPGDCFRDGYNLCRRMSETPEDYTLFLHDLRVPPTNNSAERAARKYKRKSAQVTGFRSVGGQEHYCDGLSVLSTLKARGENLFEALSTRFNQTEQG